MSCMVSGIDVHKTMLAVVVGNFEANTPPQHFERRKFANTDAGVRQMREWLDSFGVKRVVMESTAQYWRMAWHELQGRGLELSLAQAMSNKAPHGRKKDFADAERMTRRLVAGDLVLSYVPDREQQVWRMIARQKHLATRSRVQQMNALEAFLEQARIKLTSLLSETDGVSSWRILRALTRGVTDPQELADLAESNVKCSREELAGALAAARQMSDIERQLLREILDSIDQFEKSIEKQNRLLAGCLHEHQDAVARLAELPGLGADSAQQIIAEIGPKAEAFETAEHLASWIGVCPGRKESAGVSKSNRSPKGNRPMRRLLDQCAQAAIKAKGSVFELFYKRKVGHLGAHKAVWAVAHKLCKIIWKVLHEGIVYEERGPRLATKQAAKQLQRLKHTLKLLGYDVKSLRRLDKSSAAGEKTDALQPQPKRRSSKVKKPIAAEQPA